MARQTSKTTAKKSKGSRRSRAAASKRPAVKIEAAPAKVAAPVNTPPAKALKQSNSWQLFTHSVSFWWRQGRVTGVYLLVLAGLSLLLVHNFGSDIHQLKTQVQQGIGDRGVINSLTTYSLFVAGSSGSAQGSAAIYQYLLLILVSLSTIWLLRQLLGDNPPAKLRVRDAFYQGMYPLVPFTLTALVVLLEFIPLTIGAFLYTTVVQNGIAIGLVQDLIFLVILVLTAVLSLWLIAGSLFAGYIATLPNMDPVQALRSAWRLSRHYRLNIIRKLLNLLLIGVVISAVVLVPTIAVLPVLAGLVLFILGVLALPVIHGYFYMMYRELLRDQI